jgi:hypothetical protein
VNKFRQKHPHCKAVPITPELLPAVQQMVEHWYAGRLETESPDDYHLERQAINRAFARHVQERFPEIRYLDREEDMGLESLRTAKLSYRPHHLLEKQWAVREVQDRAD